MEKGILKQMLLNGDKKWAGYASMISVGAQYGPMGLVGALFLSVLAECTAERGIKFVGNKIKIVESELETLKEKGGVKGRFSRVVKPFVSLTTKIFPSEGGLVKALSQKGEIQSLFKEIFEDPVKRKRFSEHMEKYVKGVENKEEFEKSIKEDFGIKSTAFALDLYLDFRDLLYSKEILDQINELSEIEEERKEEIISKLNEWKGELSRNLESFREEFLTLDDGFSQLTPLYFDKRTASLEKWEDGFGFKLKDVNEGYDYRRKIVDEIEEELENGENILLLGEMGYSKTTTLYRVMCDLYHRGMESGEDYTIFYNIESDPIKNPKKIETLIREKAENGKVLVVVDNVHQVGRDGTGNILAFKIIDSLEGLDNVHFLFSARLPDWDDIKNREIGLLEPHYREAVDRSLKDLEQLYLKKFTIEEAEGFSRHCYSLKGEKIDEESFKEQLQEHYKNSREGHPILFKFFLIGKGMEEDVKKKYFEYLFDKKKGEVDEKKLEAALLSTILDVCNVPIKEDTIIKYGLDGQDISSLGGVLKYDEDKKAWVTLHRLWDLEFFRYLYEGHNRWEKQSIKNRMEKIIDKIIDLNDKEISYNITSGICTIVSHTKPLRNLFEPLIPEPSKLDALTDHEKADLYAYFLGTAYYNMEKYHTAIECCEEAIKLDPKHALAWSNKGVTLSELGKPDEALKCYEKAIKINPKNADAWCGKGVTLGDLGKPLNEVLKCYEKAIKLNPKHAKAWYNKGVTLGQLGKPPEEKLKCYEEAIKINPKHANAWCGKGVTLGQLGKPDKALKCYEEAIKLNPKHANAWYNKACILALKEENEDLIANALIKAIKLDGEYKKMAEKDEDFKKLHDKKWFKDIVKDS